MRHRPFLLIAPVALVVIALAALAAVHRTASGRDRSDLRPSPDHNRQVDRAMTHYRLTAALTGPTFRTVGPIPVVVVFRNADGPPTEIYKCGFWPNHWVEVVDEQGIEPPLTEWGRIFRRIFETGRRDRSIKIVVKRGETSFEILSDLNKVYRLDPGHYRAKAIYNDSSASPQIHHLASDTVSFEVVE
ncbi:hypothetical protein [Tautonia sociabilis]|uniref:Uncharacterized protein n=1 Tax=Tautonia sociabilis TaxID=2080755 RepID=A0A432MLM5_9BACT|nr:hypothetical protein [Tautonia sociabilis]RUL88036.1 hypothetical protein TsocGM_08820 [Tautonia sociabilis]